MATNRERNGRKANGMAYNLKFYNVWRFHPTVRFTNECLHDLFVLVDRTSRPLREDTFYVREALHNASHRMKYIEKINDDGEWLLPSVITAKCADADFDEPDNVQRTPDDPGTFVEMIHHLTVHFLRLVAKPLPPKSLGQFMTLARALQDRLIEVYNMLSRAV